MTDTRAIATLEGKARFRSPKRMQWLALLIGFILVVLIVWPAVMLLFGSLRTGTPLSPGTWSLDAYRNLWENLSDNSALSNSLILALTSTPLSGIIGLSLAIFVERTDAPFRKFITPIAIMLVVMAGIIYVVGWSLLANGFNGLINLAFRMLFDLPSDASLVDVESWGGLIFVQSLQSSAVVYLLMLGPVKALDRAHEEASLISGASRLRTTIRVTVPMLAPIVTGVMMIGLLAELMALPTGLILGSPADIMLLPVQVYERLNTGQPPPFSDAAAVSLLLVIVTLGLMMLQSKILGTRSFVTVTGKARAGARWKLGRWRWLVGVYVGGYIVVAFILPLASIVLASFQPYPGVLTHLTLDNYRAVFANTGLGTLIYNTVVIAVFVGLLAAVAAFLVAYISVRSSRRTGTLLRMITLLPIAMPGIIAPIAVLWAFVSVPGLRLLFGTIWIVIIALVIRVLPVTVQLGNSALQQVSTDLEEAAVVSGRGPGYAALSITGRLLTPSFLVAWCLAAIFVVSNLEIPMVLASTSTETIAVHVFGLYTGSLPSQAAALLVVMVGGLLVAGIVFVAIGKLAGRRMRDVQTR